MIFDLYIHLVAEVQERSCLCVSFETKKMSTFMIEILLSVINNDFDKQVCMH